MIAPVGPPVFIALFGLDSPLSSPWWQVLGRWAHLEYEYRQLCR